MRKSLVKEVTFGKAIAKVTVTMFTEKKYWDGIDMGEENVLTSKNIEIIANGKVVASDSSADVLEFNNLTDTLFEKANLDVTKKYTRVGGMITKGEEAGIALKTTIEEMTAELAKGFNVETEEEKQQKEEIAEAEAVVAQAEKEGIDNLMSNTQIKSWRKQYNDLYNEGGEGYIPSKVSKEAYQKASKILNRNNDLNNIIGVNEAAKILNLSTGYVKNLCAKKRIKSKKIGKTWVLDKTNLEVKEMAKIYYEDILVGTIITNRSMTVDEALNLINFDEEKFMQEQGFDDIDYNDFKLVY